MKNLLVLVMLFAVSSAVDAKSYLDQQLKDVKNNDYYNSVDIHKNNYSKKTYFPKRIEGIKDPGLININAKYEKVNDEDYQKKIAEDEKLYKKLLPENMMKISKSNEVDYYNVYRVCERLIRANNLDYVNWRIAIRKTEEINAASSNVNYIYINTALYDSIYQNPDALAFVMAHEMAHLILGHQQRTMEFSQQLAQLQQNIASSTTQNAKALSTAIYNTRGMIIMKEVRMMEYMADSEALILLTKAGYSPEKSLETLNFINAIPSVSTLVDTHPVTQERINSAIENIKVLNPDWVEEGKANIYNSDVLYAKKSSDRVSFTIERSPVEKNFYHPESVPERISRIAYVSYISGDNEKSMKYFKKLADIKESYIPYLYISYAAENLYNKTHEKKYMKWAVKAVKKAAELKPGEENVKAQLKDLDVAL